MKILAVNISHNASICQVTDGKIDFYLEEDRFNKIKNFHPDHYNETQYISIKKYASGVYDRVIFSSFDRTVPFKDDSGLRDDKIISDIIKQIEFKGNYTFNKKEHHLYHAHSGFHFSKMEDAICIVMDGGGAQPYNRPFQEIESIYYLNKKEKNDKCFYKHLTDSRWLKSYSNKTQRNKVIIDGVEILYSSECSSGQKFSLLTSQIGLGSGSESGKTMGLASYGNMTSKRPEDLAKQLQYTTKWETIKLIRKAISYTDCKNIVLSGGYALNCVNNYEYVKHFPDYNFFVDPVAHDGGTSVGAAMWLYKNEQ